MAGITHQHGVGLLLEGQSDIDTERVFGAGPFVSRLHDPGAAAGDHHEPGLGQFFPQFRCHAVQGCIRPGPGRTEHRHLTDLSIGPEYFGGKAHLLHGSVHQLQIGAPTVLLPGLQAGKDDFPHDIRVGDVAHLGYQPVDGIVHRTVGTGKMQFCGFRKDFVAAIRHYR